jgi:hypothetical protein
MPDPRVTARQKAAVTRRARGLCEYCRSPSDYSTQLFSAEHIIPRSAGGPTRLNLATREEEDEAGLVADWLAASLPSLREVWDNEEDAVYDRL